MRMLLGLSALAATAVTVNGQTVTLSGNGVNGVNAQPISFGQTALASISVRQQSSNGIPATSTPVIPSPPNLVNSNNFFITVPYTVTAVAFDFVTNTYTGQMQYRWSPGYTGTGAQAQAFTCDTCAGGGFGTCNTATGPVSTAGVAAVGYPCANLTRYYLFSNLVQSATNYFSVQVYDLNLSGSTNSSYSFIVTRLPNPVIVGDPQIVGMQGQDFQVHGMPDEIFNVVSYPSLQVNARFTYLESGACHDNFTACFAHPGTYISEEGFRVGVDKVRVIAGSFKKRVISDIEQQKSSLKC